ncbi:MAG: maltose 6'-phosphate phosphatase [Crocinitomicaceae bacterium]|jgi:maltose 6'-phosphate phosphatase
MKKIVHLATYLIFGLLCSVEAGESVLRVAAYNVEFSKNATPQQMGEMLKSYDFDVVAFSEAPNGKWTKEVGEFCGMSYAYVGKTSSANHKDKYKTILSKTPLKSTGEHALIGKGWSPASVVTATTVIDGWEIVLYSLHIPGTAKMKGSKAEALAKLIGNKKDLNVLVMGDYNNKIGDPPIAAMTSRGYQSTWKQLSIDLNKNFTYNAYKQDQNVGVIDHIFYKFSELVKVSGGGIIELDKPLSDHKPVWAEFSFPKK